MTQEEFSDLTPRRRITLSKREVPEENVWLVYVANREEESRLAALAHDQGMNLDPSEFKGNLLRLNDVGMAIWDLCDGTVPVYEIVEEVAGRFDVDEEQAQADVVGFMERLAKQGLIDLDWSPL